MKISRFTNIIKKDGIYLLHNVDRSNVADVEPLMQELRRYGIQHAKIDFGVVRAETEACQTYESNCFNDSELGSRLDQLWRLAEKYQFSRYPGLYRRFCYCGLYCDNSYTISPKGELYKCWEMVGDLKHRIGNICSSGSVDDVRNQITYFLVIEIKDDDDASDENKAKYKYAVQHFSELNKRLNQQGIKEQYIFHFLSPNSYDTFFQHLRDGSVLISQESFRCALENMLEDN